jgi:hypothetical protein
MCHQTHPVCITFLTKYPEFGLTRNYFDNLLRNKFLDFLKCLE